jgi:hypothetical protein
MLIVDQSSCLTVELKGDTIETSDEDIGLATYSNSKATVFSYVSIFENLWIQTQLNSGADEKNKQSAMISHLCWELCESQFPFEQLSFRYI